MQAKEALAKDQATYNISKASGDDNTPLATKLKYASDEGMSTILCICERKL